MHFLIFEFLNFLQSILSAKDKPVIVINIDFIQILDETFEDDFGIFYFQKLRIFLNKTNRSEFGGKRMCAKEMLII